MTKKRIDDLRLDSTRFDLLDEMEGLVKKVLLDFLNTHTIRLPKKRQDRILEEILKQTRGKYEIMLDALKDMASRAWDLSEDEALDDDSEDDDEDFGVDD